MEATEKQPFEWKNFSAGEGDTFYWHQNGGYRTGDQIDTKSIENAVINVNTKNQITNGSIPLTYIGGIVALNPFAQNSFSTYDGNIGRIYSLNNPIVEIPQDASRNYNIVIGYGQMYRSADGQNYIYAFTKAILSGLLNAGIGRIYRILPNYTGIETQLNGTDYTTWALGNGSSGTVSEELYTISEDGRIIFAHKNTIFQIDSNEIVTELLVIPENCEIKGIFKYLDTYKIYFNYYKTNQSNDGIDGYIAYWDGISNQLSQTSTYENSPIKLAVNDGAYEYVIFGEDYVEDLYYVGGLDRGEPIRVNTESSSADPTNSRIFYGYTGDIRKGDFYFTGKNKLGNTCIYYFGRFYPGLPMCLIPMNNIGDILKNNETSYQDIRIQAFSQGIYLYKDGNIFQISSFIDSRKDQEGGSITSYPFFGANQDTIKTIENLYISYILGNLNNKINIYVRKNGGPYQQENDGWTLIKSITGNDYVNKRGLRIDRFTLQNLNLGDFYQLEFKAELFSFDGSGTTYPIFFGLRMLYTDNLKD